MERVINKRFIFPSHERTYIKDITQPLNDAIAETHTQDGKILVRSMHTTLGLVLTELAEPNLLGDYVHRSLTSVMEDRRSTWAQDPEFRRHYQTTDVYAHRCADSPLLRPDEIDDDFNAARHIRCLTMASPSIIWTYSQGRLDLGRFQGIAVWEFDGRDGSGRNPARTRTVVATMYPVEVTEELGPAYLK